MQSQTQYRMKVIKKDIFLSPGQIYTSPIQVLNLCSTCILFGHQLAWTCIDLCRLWARSNLNARLFKFSIGDQTKLKLNATLTFKLCIDLHLHCMLALIFHVSVLCCFLGPNVQGLCELAVTTSHTQITIMLTYYMADWFHMLWLVNFRFLSSHTDL